MLGWNDYLQGNFPSALDSLTRADKIEPYSFRINYNLGQALIKLDRPADAIDRLFIASQIDPKNLECATLLNELLRSHQRLPDAIEIIERVSEYTDRRNSFIEITRSDTLAESGQIDAAINVLEAVKKQLSNSDWQLSVRISDRIRTLKSGKNH